jgi:hypothetical protein
MVKEISKAKGLDVLLQSWRDLSVISPEFITLELSTKGSEDSLYLLQFFIAMFSSALGWVSVVSAGFQSHAMEEKDSLFGKVGDIATSLLSENFEVKFCKKNATVIK